MASPPCPRCQGTQTYSNGWNKLKDGSKAQRFFCRNCDKTFQLGAQKESCPECRKPARKNGKTESGNQRYRCLSCKITWVASPKKAGRKPLGDRAMSSTERTRKQRKNPLASSHGECQSAWNGK